jgi:hypothetical protein
LSLIYRLYIEPLVPLPYTDLQDLKANIEDVAQENTKLKNFDIARLVDNTFIRQVQRER